MGEVNMEVVRVVLSDRSLVVGMVSKTDLDDFTLQRNDSLFIRNIFGEEINRTYHTSLIMYVRKI